MGTCTSTARHRQKEQQQHNQIASKNSIFSDTKQAPPLPPLPLFSFPNYQFENLPKSLTNFDILPSSLKKSIFHQTDTNSLIQLYSSNTTNNNSMSSSPFVSHIPPRIPVPKTRLPIYHSTQQNQTTSNVIPNNSTVSTKTMSVTNHATPPTSMQTRFGFIPRPVAPGIQQVRATTLTTRSRSISPTSIVSGNSTSSSSSVVSQRLAKTQTPTKSTINQPNSHSAKSLKTITSPRQRDSSVTKTNIKTNVQTPTTASRMRSKTPLRTSATSSSSSISSPPPTTTTTTTTKTDINAIRDRYKTEKRLNFFTRRVPLSAANGSPVANINKSPESLTNNKDNKIQLTQTNNTKINSKPKTSDEKSSPINNVTHASVTPPLTHTPSAHLSQGHKHRQRAISMLSSASAISNVLNQETLLEDDNCSLKSDDLMCDYDDTLTIDSTNKNDRTDSCSLASSTIETIKKDSPTKGNISMSQTPLKEHRSATNEKLNGNLRESLDELNRLNNFENENNRKLMTRSVSLKPPPTYLPPLEDAEQITMDVESYRQVMKDVMVVKTILHQLDRLLKHSDGANMTDSMIGSFHEFHESVLNSRRYSISTNEGNLRNTIDENSSYDDLLKEIIALRKEKEQDKQTIKLLQEQMFKYSSQNNG